MALHQPALAPHHIPRWVEGLFLAVVAAVVVFGLVLVVPRLTLVPQSASPGAQELIIEGRNGGGIRYTGIPYPAPQPAWIITGRNGGGIIYTGIPYPPPGTR